MNKTFVIILVTDITDDMVKESLNSPDSMRRSVDGTKALLKFATMYPVSMKGYLKYTYDEILEILDGPEWTP